MFINYIVSTTIEALALVAVVVTYPINVVKFDPKPCENYNQIPILMVHGYIHNSSGWLYIRHQLHKAGFNAIYTINLGSPFHSIEEYGKIIQQKIQKIKNETGSSQVRLIGHSMGGIVVSYYATTLATPDEVESIVTIGSPLHGTKIAHLGLGQSAKEMLTNSRFLIELNTKIKESQGIYWMHLASKTDLIIRPAESAIMSHANAKCYVYNCLGHASFLYSPDVARKIIQFYKK
jgi:triacylglycerol lipase